MHKVSRKGAVVLLQLLPLLVKQRQPGLCFRVFCGQFLQGGIITGQFRGDQFFFDAFQFIFGLLNGRFQLRLPFLPAPLFPLALFVVLPLTEALFF